MFGIFLRKKEVEKIKEETKKSFDIVKKDVISVGEWIKHLDSEKKSHKNELLEIREILSTIKEEIEELKSFTEIIKELKEKNKFQTPKRVFEKQTDVYTVQTPVQTPVQTSKFDNLSSTEKAIIYLLLNTDLKLSYDDLAITLQKEKSTIRGQINVIKQKSEGLIEEIVEKNGKKRVFIPEEIKNKITKNQKVRVKSRKNVEK